ncbi:transglutaminase [Bifidobacterium sp. DSM 109957]|uniref:Transglutaminase n=2 Tax=Bifidobacterium oedipodis TaxID=2675322 RepID=A0A7Y0EQS2_9BIFI|nr:transglutaminase [Bifidobacterium sp. DSM 109957]
MRRPARHFCKLGVIRPTVGALVLLAIGAGLCYGGLLLDDRTLMAATVAIVALLVLSIIIVALQWFGLLVIGSKARIVAQSEQRDQQGHVVGRIVGDLPQQRGLYVRVSNVVRWKSPFGLIAARRVIPAQSETLLLPVPDNTSQTGVSAVDKRSAGADQSEHSGGVRAYAPGDPLKLIAWRHTAHRGELMTRESSRDVRATALLVLNTHNLRVDQLDSAVRALLPCAQAVGASRSERLVITDGTQTHEGLEAVERFLAAAQPQTYQYDQQGQQVQQTHQPQKAQSQPSQPQQRSQSQQSHQPQQSDITRAAASISRIVLQTQGPVRVLVCDAADSNELLAALKHTPIAQRIIELAPTPPAEPDELRRIGLFPETTPAVGNLKLNSLARTATEATAAIPATASTTVGTAASTAGVATIGTLGQRLAGALALLTMFAMTLDGLAGMVSVDGLWFRFAAVLLALAALGTAVPSRASSCKKKRTLITRILSPATLRLLGYIIATLIAAAALITLRVYVITGNWLFRMPMVCDGSPQTETDGVVVCDTLVRADPWATVSQAFERGFDQLNLQLPPLDVSEYSDIVLIVCAAALAIVIRCLLTWRFAIPFMALLPVVALAADYAFVGHRVPLWGIGLIACAFPLALWSAQTVTHHSLPKFRRFALLAAAPPLVASVLAAAVTMPLVAPATSLAYSIPLSIGEGGGMFSSNTVSPMIDLKRNILAGSDSTVLEYQASRRLYLRMTTLDDFDGDTWGYDKQFALDAGLYGSGIRLGRNDDEDLTYEQRASWGPLDVYMDELGYSGYDVSTANENTLERFMASANVDITSLHSRFLPVPGNVRWMSGMGSDWLAYQDGTVYNRSTGTSDDTSYSVYASGVDPITSDSGFDQLNLINDAHNRIVSQQQADESDAQRWNEARRTVESNGLGMIRNDYVIIPIDYSLQDSTVTTRSGQVLGRASGGGSIGSGSDSVDMPGEIRFDGTVAEQLGLGKDSYIVAAGSNGLMLVMPVEVSLYESASSEEDARDSMLELETGSDFGASWERNAYETLQSLGWADYGFSSHPGSLNYGNSRSDAIEQAIVSSDQRAHADRFTALPNELPDNIRAVVQQAHAAGVSTDPASYEEQTGVMRWLVNYFTNPENGFSYSLNAPDGDGRSNLDMLDAFLDPETGHVGYCQHYASALAVLGRALGLPTRIVLGYNAGTGERGENGSYAVASKQLHAWTEVYFDGIGWVPFDVTPATEENGSATGETSSATVTSPSGSDSDLEVTIAPDDSADDADQSDDAAADTDQSNEAQDDTNVDVRKAGDDSTARHQRLADWLKTLPIWARVLLAMAALLVLAGIVVAAACAPRAWRWLRRRRVYRAIARADASPHDMDLSGAAWRSVWREIQRTAHVRSKPTDTDCDVAATIVNSRPADKTFVESVMHNATAASFGGRPAPVADLDQQLQRYLAAGTAQSAHKRHAGKTA